MSGGSSLTSPFKALKRASPLSGPYSPFVNPPPFIGSYRPLMAPCQSITLLCVRVCLYKSLKRPLTGLLKAFNRSFKGLYKAFKRHCELPYIGLIRLCEASLGVSRRRSGRRRVARGFEASLGQGIGSNLLVAGRPFFIIFFTAWCIL